MNRAANSMSGQLANYGEAAAPHLALHGASNFPNSKTGSRHQHGVGEGSLRAGDEIPPLLRHVTDGDGDSCIRHESIFLDSDIELDQITWLQSTSAGNAVDSFIVETDAAYTGKFIDQRRCGLCSVLPHHAGPGFVEFGSGNSRPHFVPHGFQH